MAPKLFDVFLSYRSKEAAWVDDLREELQRRGLKVWMDKGAIRPGDLFADSLHNGVGSCRSVAFVVTPELFHSAWVRQEYQRACDLERAGEVQIIPILKEGSLPAFLADRHAVDFRHPETFSASVDKLIWPGVTGKALKVFALHGAGGFPWPHLASVARERGLATFGSDYVETAISEFPTRVGNDRAVVFVDPLEDWPFSDSTCRHADVYAETIFRLRLEHRGVKEFVFVLYCHPDAASRLAAELAPEQVSRLSHYFRLPKCFEDSNRVNPSETDIKQLKGRFDDVMRRVQRELLRTEHC